MSEKREQLEAIGRLLWVVVFALLYAWGGMEMKWLRRFLAPIWLCGGMYLFSRNWKVFLQLPLMVFGFTKGYGAVSVWDKIVKRATVGLLVGGSPLWLALAKRWKFYLFNTLLVISAYVVFGVWGPFFSARIEETVIGFLAGFLSMMSAKRED